MNKKKLNLVRPTPEEEEEEEIAAQLAEIRTHTSGPTRTGPMPRRPRNSSPRPTSGRCDRKRPWRPASSSG